MITPDGEGRFRVTMADHTGSEITYVVIGDRAAAERSAEKMAEAFARRAAGDSEKLRNPFIAPRKCKRSTDPAVEARRAKWREKAQRARERRASKSQAASAAPEIENGQK